MINTLPKSLIETATKMLMESRHPMIEVDGGQKHRHNSEGRPIHHTDEGIKNFHRWFGSSKTVDAHGRPQVFYHGTGNPSNFDKFDPKKSFTGIGATFFSPDKHFADSYNYHHNAGMVMPVYIKSVRPFDLHDDSHKQKLLSHMEKNTYYNTFSGKVVPLSNNFPRSRDFFQMEHHNVINSIKDIRHDSFLVDEKGSTNIGVFNPKNVKSAIGNNGTFNKTSKLSEGVDDQTDHHYNFIEWKKAARNLGATVKNTGPMAGTPNKVNIWYASHPENDDIGGQFFNGKGWNYGHLSYPKLDESTNSGFNKTRGTYRGAQLISSQGYLDDDTVDQKSANKDYHVQVSPEFEVDGDNYRVITDGHHSLSAAIQDGVTPNFHEQSSRENDHIAALEKGDVDLFLQQTHQGDDWRNRVTGKSVF